MRDLLEHLLTVDVKNRQIRTRIRGLLRMRSVLRHRVPQARHPSCPRLLDEGLSINFWIMAAAAVLAFGFSFFFPKVKPSASTGSGTAMMH